MDWFVSHRLNKVFMWSFSKLIWQWAIFCTLLRQSPRWVSSVDQQNVLLLHMSSNLSCINLWLDRYKQRYNLKVSKCPLILHRRYMAEILPIRRKTLYNQSSYLSCVLQGSYKSMIFWDCSWLNQFIIYILHLLTCQRMVIKRDSCGYQSRSEERPRETESCSYGIFFPTEDRRKAVTPCFHRV